LSIDTLALSQPIAGKNRVPKAVLLLLAAGVASGWTLVLADAFIRTGWPYFSHWGHWTGALGLYGAVGALFGLGAWLIIALESWLIGDRAAGRHPWLGTLRPAFYGLVAALASISTAKWTFAGEQAQKSVLAIYGPLAFCVAVGLAAAAGAAILIFALRPRPNRARWLFATSALLFAAAVAVSRVDLTAYVSLYSRVHTILELVAALCFGACYALCFAHFGPATRTRRVIDGFGSAALLWIGLTLFVSSVRTWFDESLKHVWLEEVYVGRMLRRLQVAEAFFADPLHWRGMRMARIETLKARYRLQDLSPSAAWSAPLAEPPDQWNALRRLRGGQKHYNVVVYYVDTLRADVARDPRWMPELSEFRRRSLDFKRAYAVGSDTLRSLPALTGGNYDVLDTPENDLLRVAKRADYETGIVIAKSAQEFIGKLRPDFYFDDTRVVEDYPAEQQVWGYGAQRPTAPRLVDRALDFVDKPRKTPFFLWLFNFDQHNWRELDNDYVKERAERFGLADDDAALPYRYRVVARSIDAEFGRLLAGLERRRLMGDTIVLFVSDHGEALGRDGFWVHSVFLWESLIRVPLVLYVPGLLARAIDNKVSLVDVAPTLGRYLDPTLDGTGYQGEDLLSQLLPQPTARRFPLLLVSASKDLLVRVGVVDPVREFKLVLSFEAALPELYDLTASDPDAANLASARSDVVRGWLQQLVRSPVFPRSADDFEVRNTRAQRALEPSVDSTP
jgi:hypothetical protein